MEHKTPEELGHVLYEPNDFTNEEIDNRNKLAIAVVEGGLAVCKLCGEYEAGLENKCKRNNK